LSLNKLIIQETQNSHDDAQNNYINSECTQILKALGLPLKGIFNNL
jgi:hypothetical protein